MNTNETIKKQILIADTAIEDYKIVYSSESLSDVVENFRRVIEEKCGCLLEAVKDTGRELSEYEILVGDCDRAESKNAEKPTYLGYAAKLSGSKLVLKSGGEHSMVKLLADIAERIFDSDKNTINAGFSIVGRYVNDPCDHSKPDDSHLRIMSCNILAEFQSWGYSTPVSQRKEIFFSALDQYQPTVIGLQEMSPMWYEVLSDYSDVDSWNILKIENPNKENGEYVFSTVMYRSDLYALVDSGMQFYSAHNNARCRSITWALLKEKSTDREFCMVSTHWDGGMNVENTKIQVSEISAFVSEMQKKYPVFTTGDFNRNEFTDEFKAYLANADICDAKYSAELRVNNIGSWHEFGKYAPSVGSCDHITATKDTTVLKYQTLIDNELIYGSDHCWLIADIRFDK